jgi:hypothetical protein
LTLTRLKYRRRSFVVPSRPAAIIKQENFDVTLSQRGVCRCRERSRARRHRAYLIFYPAFAEMTVEVGGAPMYPSKNIIENAVNSKDHTTLVAAVKAAQLTFWFDGGVLPRKYGFPMKLRIPTKLGFKNPKHIDEIEIGDDFNGGYWETYGYNWFSGL